MSDIELFRRISLFRGLSKDDLKFISSISKTKTCEKKEIVLYEREAGDALYIIFKGEVKVSLVSEDGREVILAYLKEGDFFGEMALFTTGERSARVSATKKSQFVVLHQRDFITEVQKKPVILFNILKEMSQRLKEADKKISSLAFLDVSGRLARYFIDLVNRLGKKVPGGIIISKKPTAQEISQVIGTTRETVSRTIKTFRDKGIIEVTPEGIFIRDTALSGIKTIQ